ncbi:MAG TPA: Atxe2 family lasso peptide isopeptidase [Rhodanobacter sp.]|nr:Atxe2 family lasso peptide isopeptidase [Rhodanobacter sp.]
MSRSQKGEGFAVRVSRLVTILLWVLGMWLGVVACGQAGEAISPRRLIEVVDISGPVVSPDGRYVAFRTEQASVERNTYDSVWYVQAMDGKTPAHRVGEGGAPLRSSAGLSLPAHAVWSPDGHWIYYRAFMHGKVAVWRASADGSSAKPITIDPADVRDFSLGANGKALDYSVGATRAEVMAAEQSEYERGIHIDSSVPIGQGSLFRSGNVGGRLATQRLDVKGDGFARVPLLSDVPDHWKAVDLATGKTRDLAPSQVPSPETITSVLPDGLPRPWRYVLDAAHRRAALLTRVGKRGDRVRKPDVELSAVLGKPSKQIKCKAELCVGKAISGVQWRPNSDEVIYTVTDPAEGMAQSLFRWNVKSGAVVPVAHSAGLLNGGDRYGLADAGCGASPAALACVAADANRPPHVERIDLATGDRRLLFDPNVALAADVSAAPPVQLLRWQDASGQLFTGQYFAAHQTNDRPPPLFVAYYFCPGFLRSGYGGEWPLETFAEHGISALCINYGPLYFDAVRRFNEGLSAVRSAVDMLASSGKIDRTRVGMGELSFGTEVTMWTAFNSDLLAATSITGAVMSQSMYLDGSLKGKEFTSRARKVWQLGSLEETPRQWERIGLQFNLDKMKAPVLMQVPEQEYEWLLDSAVPLILEHKADMYVFPQAPHFKFQPKQLLAANKRNVDWFRFWLQDYEDPTPGKRAQYAHWRDMRAHVSRRDDKPASDKHGN